MRFAVDEKGYAEKNESRSLRKGSRVNDKYRKKVMSFRGTHQEKNI